MAVARAASAHTTGADDSEIQAELAGRQFTFRIRFGCSGPDPQPERRPMTWTYDEKAQTLKVRAKPNISLDLPIVRALAAGEYEDVQGFWVPRPWVLSPSCPAAPTGMASSPPPPSLGIAQFYTSADSRARRRPGRAFETVQRLGPESVPGAQGLDLVLTGRLQPAVGKKVVRCTSPNPAERPLCIVSAEFSSVSIENPSSGSSLADWAIG